MNTLNISPNITITDIAAEMISQNIEDSGQDDLYLTFYVAGGGCSGLQYGLALCDGEPEIDDVIVYSKDIKIAIESRSVKYVDGCVIDYVTLENNAMGGGFKINNPNAVKSCGCGKSFSGDENDEISSLNNGGGCSSCR